MHRTLIPCLALLAGCGGDATPPGDQTANTAPSQVDIDPVTAAVGGSLTLRVGERALATTGTGRVRDSVVTPSASMVNLTLTGSLDGGTMTQPRDLWFIIKLDATKPGTYPLVRYDNMVADQDGSQGWIEIGASRALDLPQLSPDTGTITLEQIKLAGDGTPKPTRLRGSFEGSFFGDGDDQHAVSGSFDFAAP